MPSSATRRPEPNLELFVTRLDERLRAEVGTMRRATLPAWLNRWIRAVRVRASVLVRGGAMVLTTVAVLLALGTAPLAPGAEVMATGNLVRPSLSQPSLLVVKGALHVAAVDDAGSVLAAESVRGLLR